MGEMQEEKLLKIRKYILISVMLAMFMGAIEGTIVATAIPAIVGDLGGFSLYSWVFSAYLLMSTVTVLIYGKLADLFGRRPVLSFGIIIFLIGSFLCGIAHTMEQLIIFRFIQGIGAGAVMPIASTIVGDVYTGEDRARVQGYLSSVWGISAVMGPAVGGLLVQYVSWRWVFWVNIPLGIFSIIGLYIFFKEEKEKKKRDIDFLGSFLFMLSISIFMFILVEGGVRWEWFSKEILLLFLLSAFLFYIFLKHEQKFTEPMMPLHIWKNKPIRLANIVSFTTGLMLIGISSFLPAYVQGVMEKTATIAGFTLTAMSIGWPIASTFSGKLIIKIGFRITLVIGGIFLMLGSVLFVTIIPQGGPLGAAFASFFVGIGMGLTSTAFIVMIQNSTSWSHRGVATASNMFMRNLGNTVGAALLGAILNNRILAYFSQEKSDIVNELTIESTNMLLNVEERVLLSEELKVILQNALSSALNYVYIAVLVFACISFIFIYLIPKDVKN